MYMKRWAIIILIAVGISAVVGAGLYIYFGTNLIRKEVTAPPHPVFVSPSSKAQNAITKQDETLCGDLFYPEKIVDCRLDVLSAKNTQPTIEMCDSIPNSNQTVLYVFPAGGSLKAITGFDYCVVMVSDVLRTNYCNKITNDDTKQACQNYLKIYDTPAQ